MVWNIARFISSLGMTCIHLNEYLSPSVPTMSVELSLTMNERAVMSCL